MKYSTTFYLLFKLSLGNPPEGFMDQPYKSVLEDIVSIAGEVETIQQIIMFTATTELDELTRAGYFDDESVSVQELLDELKENEPVEYKNALISYREVVSDSDE